MDPTPSPGVFPQPYAPLPGRPLMVLIDVVPLLLASPQEPSAHRDALQTAIMDVCGLDVKLPSDRDNHTDFTLVFDALNETGMADFLSEAAFNLIADAEAAHLRETLPDDLSSFVPWGATSTLEKLHTQEWVKVVPLSGYAKPALKMLVQRSGLDGPLAVGFSSCAYFGATRPDLFDQARSRAGGFGGIPWPINRTVYVSASSSALGAARSMGVRTVAVGQACPEAEAYVPSLDDLPGVLLLWR